jgi:phospholipid/cholesterol/gamma-HCH transport system substrate-binding protein
MTRTRNALVGVFYIALVVALIWLSIAVYNRDFANVVKVSVRTDSVGSSLQKGSDVEVRGILVGTVTGVSTDGDGARVSLDIDGSHAKQIPADVTAELLPKTLFGERYVDLVLPAQPTGTLTGGEVIQQNTSAQGVELQDLFNQLLPVLQAVRPDQLATLLGDLSEALDGHGVELGQTVTTFTGYLKEFSPQVPALTADIAAFGRVADTYTAAAPDLLAALNNLTTTSFTLVADRQQLADLFANVQSASSTVSGVVSADADNIITLSRQSVPTLQVLANYSSEFPCLSQSLADFIPVADKAFGAGTTQPGLHIKLQIVPSLGSYLPGQRGSTSASGPPSCPTSDGGVAGTALESQPMAVTGGTDAPASHTPGSATPGTTSSATTSSTTVAATGGIGTANSPQENELIAELIAPTVGVAPSQFPDWGSLLLGPLLRGTQVTVQ